MDPPDGAVAPSTESCVAVDSSAWPSYPDIQQVMSGNEHKCGCISHQRLSKFDQFKNATLKVSFGESVYGFQRVERRNRTPTYYSQAPPHICIIDPVQISQCVYVHSRSCARLIVSHVHRRVVQ